MTTLGSQLLDDRKHDRKYVRGRCQRTRRHSVAVSFSTRLPSKNPRRYATVPGVKLSHTQIFSSTCMLLISMMAFQFCCVAMTERKKRNFTENQLQQRDRHHTPPNCDENTRMHSRQDHYSQLFPTPLRETSCFGVRCSLLARYQQPTQRHGGV